VGEWGFGFERERISSAERTRGDITVGENRRGYHHRDTESTEKKKRGEKKETGSRSLSDSTVRGHILLASIPPTKGES
jgi:hypothetical protein